jgi:hypothetical protein
MKKILFVAMILIIVLILNVTPASAFIRYEILKDNTFSVLLPFDGFYFTDETLDEQGIVYSIIEHDNYGSQRYDEKNNLYYLEVAKKYLGNDNVQLYATGEYWNIFGKPIVKVNGIKVDQVDIENGGEHGHFIWSKIYNSKLYHITYQDTIEADKSYEFHTWCGNENAQIRVVFTDDLSKYFDI